MYYDRDGSPMTLEQWGARFEDRDYKIVERTELADGSTVSTVWLGLDHNFFGDGPPLIFETMIFPDCTEMWRYATEAEARAGHAAVVGKLAN